MNPSTRAQRFRVLHLLIPGLVLSVSCGPLTLEAPELTRDAGSSTSLAVCGNGTREPGEDCDDGNVLGADGCSATCRTTRGFVCDEAQPNRCVPRCGDGIPFGEACDDGNTSDGDGCGAACRVEEGWTCDSAEPSRCAPICGDGLRLGFEACDDGNTREGDGCSPTCVQRNVWAPLYSAPFIQPRYDHAAVWTGTEMFVWGGLSSQIISQGFLYDPATGLVRVTASQGAPDGYGFFDLVWTGSLVLVLDLQFEGRPVGRYDPQRGVWLPAGAPCPLEVRSEHVAVWSGTELIVWGGHRLDDNGRLIALFGDGARYDPVLDVWSPMDELSAPSPRADLVGVWTGSELVVFGGTDGARAMRDGARYDPVLDLWSPISALGSPEDASDVAAVWSGSEVIVLADVGGRYDPELDLWRPLAEAPIGLQGVRAVWTGSEALVWDGVQGKAYLPAVDAWLDLPEEGAPPASYGASVVWSGSEMLIWGGTEGGGARYRPASRTWSPITFPSSPPSDFGQSVLWTGTEMLTWGGGEEPVGGRYDPSRNVWRWLSTEGAPSARSDQSAVWTGAEMVIFGGRDFDGVDTVFLGDGARYHPDTDVWRPLAEAQAPGPRAWASAVWTGSEVVLWGGFGPDYELLGDGARYDPALDAWRPMSAFRAPTPRIDAFMAWTGTEVLVWGGALSDIMGYREAAVSDGALYDPQTDAWRPMPPGPEAMLDGGFAVWTGVELLVWDSQIESEKVWRYDPAMDTWSWTLTPPPPIRDRGNPASVWTGWDVIFWGGFSLESSAVPADGAIYDPLANAWTSLPTEGAPSAREEPLAVWTGSEMLIWGAGREGGRFLR